jgi:hypothetical protein
MVDGIILKAILIPILSQNGLEDTDVGKSTFGPAGFFQ